MHTKHTGILTFWKLPLDDTHHIRVIIWADEDSMHAAFNKAHPNDLLHDFYGRCDCWIWVENNKTGERKAPAKFAEVHLVISRMGAGYVAHELQHALHYWQDFKDWNILKNDETIAYLIGDLTTGFWNAFYDRFERTPGP
jgi:hypothetical protein